MAKFTPGPVVAAVSGSIGGTTFSHNRGGMYMRNRSIPIISTTVEALAAKTRLTTASQSWQGLTEGQRLAWQEFANANPVIDTLGAPRVLSGAQAYIGIHTRMSLEGTTPLTAPPIIAAPAGLTLLTQDADIGAGDTDATFAATPLAAGVKLYIRAAVTSSAGIRNVQSLLRFVGFSAAAEVSPFDDQSLIETRLGTLVVGQTLHVEISTYDTATGLISGPIRDDVVVTTS